MNPSNETVNAVRVVLLFAVLDTVRDLLATFKDGMAREQQEAGVRDMLQTGRMPPPHMGEPFHYAATMLAAIEPFAAYPETAMRCVARLLLACEVPRVPDDIRPALATIALSQGFRPDNYREPDDMSGPDVEALARLAMTRVIAWYHDSRADSSA